MERDKTMNQSEMLDLLWKSGYELDQVISTISDTLNDGNNLTRKDLGKNFATNRRINFELDLTTEAV